MIEVRDKEYFNDVIHFANANACLLKLAERIDYLSRHDGGGGCLLSRASEPYSFSFKLLDTQGQTWFDGKLLYDDHSWSIHT